MPSCRSVSHLVHSVGLRVLLQFLVTVLLGNSIGLPRRVGVCIELTQARIGGLSREAAARLPGNKRGRTYREAVWLKCNRSNALMGG